MKISKKLLTIFMVFSILFCICACSKTNENRDTAVLPDLNSSESVIYVINRGDISDSEYSVVSSLQGITAQNSSKIYIEDGENIVFLEKYLNENSYIQIKRINDFQALIRLPCF